MPGQYICNDPALFVFVSLINNSAFAVPLSMDNSQAAFHSTLSASYPPQLFADSHRWYSSKSPYPRCNKSYRWLSHIADYPYARTLLGALLSLAYEKTD